MTKIHDPRLLPYTISEAELARRTGMRPVEWQIAALRLESIGFPKIHPIIGARLRAAVDKWFDPPDAAGRLPTAAFDGEENWDARSRRHRADDLQASKPGRQVSR